MLSLDVTVFSLNLLLFFVVVLLVVCYIFDLRFLVCFVILNPGFNPNEKLREELKNQVIKIMGKTLKPREIKFVNDLPKTRSAKIIRGIIKAKYLGEDISDISSVENPSSVEEIKNAI